MNLIDTVKDFFFASDDDDEDINDTPVRPEPAPAKPERISAAPAPSVSPSSASSSASSVSSASFSSYSSPTAKEREEAAAEALSKRNKVVNIQATAQLQVVLVKPSTYPDAKQIADHLISKKTVVVNLETASAENKRRILDFLAGVAYINGGSLKPIANLTYIITPYSVGFIGEDLVGELENNGVFI